MIITRFPRRGTLLPPQVIRYGDDFAVLHRDRQVIEQCETIVTEWLRPMGLQLKPSKTRIAHTLKAENGEPGFDFLGFVRHEVVYTAVMTKRIGHNLVCCHQYPTKPCGRSNPTV